MEKDAVSAGVSEIGGLFSTAEIRILLCYLISSIGKPVPGRMLADVLHYEGIANVFEVNDSIAALCENGHLECVDANEDTYIITKSGKDVAETLKTTLSITVKERAFSAALKMVSRFNHSKETDIKISRDGDKTFITCSAIDSGEPFLSVKLLVADEDQAVYIKEKFLEDPSKIASEIIEMLTKKK